MFIAYLDSSGRPNFDDKENFVLASMITNERHWQYIDNGVRRIKLRHFPNLPDSEVEIHAKDMQNREGVFKGLSWSKIYSVLGDVFDFIADKSTEICIIAVVIDKVKLRKGKDIDIETWAYRLLFERINKFVERQKHIMTEAQYQPEYGIMITDSEGVKKDQKLRGKLLGMSRKGTLYSRLDVLIEDLLFTDSKWRNLSQLVDCVAYCIRKQYRTNSRSFHTFYWQSYYKRIETKFDNPRDSYFGYGLKIFP